MNEIVATSYQSELDFIARCVLDYPNLETGGDYFGFWNKHGLPVVLFVTGPGPRTNRSATSFYQDIEYLHKTGNYLHDNYAIEHIGSWHSHHVLGLEQPSSGDINTMRNTFVIKKLTRFFITICNIRQECKVKIGGFLFSTNYRNFYEEVKWNVIEQISPFRTYEHSNLLFPEPRNQTAIFQVYPAEKRLHNATEPEKVVLSQNSYFETQEGRAFLQSEFLKIQNHPDCKDVELLQNEDKTLAIAFKFNNENIEVRYPSDFSKDNLNLEIIEKDVDAQSQIQVAEPVEQIETQTFVILKAGLFKGFKVKKINRFFFREFLADQNKK